MEKQIPPPAYQPSEPGSHPINQGTFTTHPDQPFHHHPPNTSSSHLTDPFNNHSIRPLKTLRKYAYLESAISTLVGTILLFLCTFSTPFIKGLYYAKTTERELIRLGTFGFCKGQDGQTCSGPSIGVSMGLGCLRRW